MKVKNYLGDNMPILPWMINFGCPKKQCYVQEKNLLKNQANLSVHSKCANYLLTALSVTISIDNLDANLMEKLLKNNIRIFCIDMSRGTVEQQEILINVIRKVIENFGIQIGRVYPFGIALELVGLRIRTGTLDSDKLEDILLVENHYVYLTTNDNYSCHCNKDMIYVNYKGILDVLNLTHLIYIDYGAIILKVVEIGKTKIHYNQIKCKIISGGKLRDKAIIHVPNIPQEEEIAAEMVKFAMRMEVDALIISNVRMAHTVDNIREIIGEEDKPILLLAKIESSLGVENIDSIIDSSDGIVLARGELGLELPPEKLFIIQKSIIAKCNQIGKPVICSGQFVNQMQKKLLPSRAEMLDVANVILDGTDGIILSEDIVNSPNIYEALHAVQSICLEAENAVYQEKILKNLLKTIPIPPEPIYSIAISAVDASARCHAACIIVLTVTGRSAKLIAQYRPLCPIIAVTRYGHVARKLNFWRAVTPIQLITKPREIYLHEVDNRFNYAITFGKYAGLIHGGDALVLVSGWKELSGFNNTIRIVYASQNNCQLHQKNVANSI